MSHRQLAQSVSQSTPGRPVVIGLREHVHVTLEAISRCRLHGRVRATADGTGHLELDQAIF